MKKLYIILLFTWALIGTSTYVWFDTYPIKNYIPQTLKESIRDPFGEGHYEIDQKPIQATKFITIVGLLLILGVALIDRPKKIKP